MHNKVHYNKVCQNHSSNLGNLDNKIKAQNNPTDINDLISGVYGVYACGAVENIKNLPEASSGVLVVFSNPPYIAQMYISHSTNLYIRIYIGEWTTWKKL